MIDSLYFRRSRAPIIAILCGLCLVLVSYASDQKRNWIGESSKINQLSQSHSNRQHDNLPRDWFLLKERLCPLGVPNTTYGEPLFRLARDAMFHSKNESTTSVPNSDLIKQFYHGFFDHKEAMSIYRDENVTLAYVRIYKCGNNFIRGYEKAAFRRMNNKTGAGSFQNGVSPSDAASILEHNQSKAECILTAIRDPVSHFLSGYNEIEYRILANELNSRAKQPPEFLRLPYGDEPSRENRFEQFLRDVLTLGWHRFKGLGPLHFTSMSRILSALDEKGLRLTSYLPSVDNLASSWPIFVEQECPQVPSSYFKHPTADEALGAHGSSKDEVGFYGAAKSVWHQQGNAAKALCLIHALDYACWDKLPDGIPNYCVGVYEEDLFRATVLG